jgi:hypothetical protein
MEMSQLHAYAAIPPGMRNTVPIALEAGWTPEQAWKLWSGEKSLAGNRTPAV